MSGFVTRFAPSPSGYLHRGHAYSAAIAYRAARRANGRFLLRIEDIDKGRCRPEFDQAILDDLAWLGLKWEEPVRRQSSRFVHYANVLKMLAKRGFLYRCFKTRREVAEEIARAPNADVGMDAPDSELPGAPEGPPFVSGPIDMDEEKRRVFAGEPYAWRLSTARARAAMESKGRRLTFVMERLDGSGGERIDARPEIFGDPILGRKDFPASYHLASVVDDADQGVTHVIRGDDLAAAAHLHVLLQALLDAPTPIYRRHKLVCGPDGKRLAKRDKSETLRSLRAAGVPANQVLADLGVEIPIDAPPPDSSADH
ncbi:MAG: tRNA glutamyl-Q(34) synthetase GluQRS [Alphaproteobacteria bacterium]|nr:tRNA glutamyl-Q(34) synthetase GluQRS [Alphaproteobacteria bacterium]